MKKNILFLIILTCLISGCGFNPIYSTDKINFNILEIQKKDGKLNDQISKALYKFSDNKSDKNFKIRIDTKKTKKVLSRDSKGDPTRYQLELSMVLTLDLNDNSLEPRNFSRKIDYDNSSDKFNLVQYELELEKILINKIIEDCLIFFSNQ